MKIIITNRDPMIYEYLESNYHLSEPIFFSDVNIPNVSRAELNRMFAYYCSKGKLSKYERDIYFIPGKTLLNPTGGPTAETVAGYKYISRGTDVFGFYSGSTFANQLGISTQVPKITEIVSNAMTAKVKQVSFGNELFIVRKPPVLITKENALSLQFLDLLKNIDNYADDFRQSRKTIETYLKRVKITASEIDRYIGYFPMNVYKNYYDLRLYEIFAS